jgi:hypothetical protein
MKVDCAGGHHVALLSPDFLLRLGFSRQARGLDLKERSGAAVAERGDEPSFRSSGGAGAGELGELSQFYRPGAGEEAGGIMNARQALDQRSGI